MRVYISVCIDTERTQRVLRQRVMTPALKKEWRVIGVVYLHTTRILSIIIPLIYRIFLFIVKFN